MADSTEFINDLIDYYKKETKKILNVHLEEKENIIDILKYIHKFSLQIGMDLQFKNYFPQISYLIRYGEGLQEWIHPRSRYPKEIKQAIILLTLITAVSFEKINLSAVDELETAIEKRITRERNVITTLLFFVGTLSETFLPKNKIIFKPEYFEIDEVLIPENALAAALATFRLASLVEHPNIQNSINRIFKIFYIYYCDLNTLLPYSKFLSLNQKALERFTTNERLTRFYFETMTRIMDSFKKSPFFEEESVFVKKYVHPLLVFDNFTDIIENFFVTLHEKTSDYLTNLDRYAKDLKSILYYIWEEITQIYRISQDFEEEEVDIEDIKQFAKTILEPITSTYFELHVIPGKPILNFLSSQSSSNLLNKLLETSLPEDSTNHFISNLVSNDIVKSFLKTGVGNFGVDDLLQTSVIKRFIQLDFKNISRGVQFFWKTYTKSSEFQKLVQKGDTDTIIYKFVDYIKEPALFYIRKGVNKIPFGEFINLQNLGAIIEVLLRNIKSYIAKEAHASSSIFTSTSQLIVDFAENMKKT